MSTLKVNQISNATGSGDVLITGGKIISSGAILQVVQTHYGDTFTANPGAGNFATVTGYQASITPRYASSKILVNVDLYVGCQAYQVMIRLLRNGSFIFGGNNGSPVSNRPSVTFYQNAYPSASPQYQVTRAGGMVFDSPDTTSEVTYSVQIKDYSTNAVYVNRSHAWQNTTDYDGAGSSFLTLMEVAQ